MRLKCFVSTAPFCQYDDEANNVLSRAGVSVNYNPFNRRLTEDELKGLISGYDILIAGTEPITRGVLNAADKLKLISRVGIGLDSVDILYAKEKGIDLSYTPDAPSPAVAELAFGLIFNLLRNVSATNNSIKRGEWNRYTGLRLANLTVGVVGHGRIGSRLVGHLASFGVENILIHDNDPSTHSRSIGNCTFVDKKTLIRESDVISIHVPLSLATKNFIASEELSLMKTSAYLINTARGGIVNEQDLADALTENKIAGAAVDTFVDEPYVGSLKNLDNTLLTAHMGSMTRDCRVRMELEASLEVARFANGEPLASPVPEAEYDLRLSHG